MSNDLLMTEGNPDWHIQGSCEDAIMSRRWSMIVIHIPCTAMAVCGNSTYGRDGPKHQERLDAIDWTLKVWDMAVSQADCVALENPASVIFPILRDTRGADVQYIQPWQFGHPEMKKTGFALWRLPRLTPTNNVYAEMMTLPRKERERIHFMSPGPDRAKERARFFSGFAEAMADQWTGPVMTGQQSLF